jgi:hypothetical protein
MLVITRGYGQQTSDHVSTKAKLKPTKSAYGFLIRSLAQDAPLCSDLDGWWMSPTARFDWFWLILTDKSDNGDESCAHAPGQKRHIRHVLAVLVWILSLQWSQTYHSLLQREVLRFLRPLLEWVQSVQSRITDEKQQFLAESAAMTTVPVQ